MSEDSNKKVAAAVDKINKMFGKGSMGKLGSMEGQDVEYLSTGSIAIDNALSGGYAIGRMIEIFGPESSGKTTLTIHAIAEAQKRGMVCAFIDLEHAFDPFYAGNLGVNIDDLLFTQPDSGDDAWTMIETLLDENAVDLIVVDSVAAMTPQKIIDGEITDANIGLHAKMMSQGIHKTRAKGKKTNTTMFFINQLRDNVGVTYGPSEITTGGRALKFAYSQRIETRKQEPIKDGAVIVANRTRAKIVKNKCGVPFREAYFNIVFGKGIDVLFELLEACVETEVMEKRGAWYYYGDTTIGQGANKARALLEDNPELVEELQERVNQALYGEEPDEPKE